MKKVIFLLGLIVFVSTCKHKQETNHKELKNRGYIVQVGDFAPDFTVKTLDGETFKLLEKRGKVVMLQFTASWCGVCRKEMPFIEKDIYQKYKDKDFVLLALDRDEPAEKIHELVASTGITYPVAFDPNADVFGLYAHKEAGVTRNVIIDRNGKIIYLTRLFNKEEFDGMKKVIDAELKQID